MSSDSPAPVYRGPSRRTSPRPRDRGSGVIGLPRLRRRQLLAAARKCRDALLLRRYLIVLRRAEGWSYGKIAGSLSCSTSTAAFVVRRFLEGEEAGLIDRREDNGRRKMHGLVLLYVWKLLEKSPPDFGWRRPTWTRELLILTLKRNLKVAVSPPTMSRALRDLGARRGRPRPIVACPWNKAAQTRRLNVIRSLVVRACPEEPVLFGDEVDVHFNPKIGWDWMLPGQQRTVLTPGKNEKRYVAGALDARTDELRWVEGPRKTSALFVALLRDLAACYPHARLIHIVVDNWGIHDSRQTQAALRALGGRIQLHFLPPYSPNENPIERVWQDFHANVTRNHRCRTMNELMGEVRVWLRRRARCLAIPARKAA